jgi:hypothetical protein
MWKVTYKLTHPTNIMTAENPLPANMMDKVNEMRIWAMENGLLDSREEIVSPTEKHIIYIWDSKESNQAWRARFIDDITYLETHWPAHMSESSVTHSKKTEAI